MECTFYAAICSRRLEALIAVDIVLNAPVMPVASRAVMLRPSLPLACLLMVPLLPSRF